MRMSPNLFHRSGDGEVILQALRDAERNPISVPIDPTKLARKPRYFKVDFRKGKTTVPTVVSVPERDENDGPMSRGRSNHLRGTPKSSTTF